MDSSDKPSAPRFFGYPKAVKGPSYPYKRSADANPVLSGLALVVVAWIVSKLEFVQRSLWSNAGFDSLRKIEDLKKYWERWDPTVIPISNDFSLPYKPDLSLESFQGFPKDLPGRYHTILEYHELYVSGKLTPLAVVESLLPLIRRDINSPSHHSIAFVDSHPDAIIEAAKASTLRYKEGRPLGVLDGIPTAVKDELKVVGYRATHGRKKNDQLFQVSKESAWSVQKWEEAGGIIMGKLNMHEIGADTTSNNINWGTPRNPHNDQYFTGGSSGGAAYAVASGLIPFALGTDGGGSVRIPSSFCGIYGLKPSHSRLDDTGSTMTVTGPLAANMSDLEAAYRVMATPNPADPTSSLFAPPGAFPSNHQKVLGVYKEWFERADPAVLAICNSALDYYREKLGYTIVPIEIPYMQEGQIAHAFTLLAEMANRARNHPVSKSNWLSGFSPANKFLLGVGNSTPSRDYLLAQQLRQLLMQHLAFLYQQHPGLLIITPVTPIAGWPIAQESDLKYGFSDGNSSIRNMEYAWMANFCGNPAISCPVGYAKPAKGKGEGEIPVGMMAMGEWGSEDQLILWGREAERWLNEQYPSGRRRPANWEDAIELGLRKLEDMAA